MLYENMRTTIELRADLHRRIVRDHGKRKISETINGIVAEHYSGKRKDMFGADPWLKDTDMSDLRDKNDRDI